jgi:ATP-dependent Lhr-like helicase
MGVFERLAPYIQDFIYQNKWTELRDIQVAACEVIFDSDDNLLLSSGTASGKTEAAFLPILTELYNKPSRSVGALYISPLKALINDQFKRLDLLLTESDLLVCKWHGDASVTEKNKLVKNPKGILQITPESLESLLIHKRGACLSLFSDLRFVIIDEVHQFMRDSRGIQVLCLLERMQRLTGKIPRRVGLSATLGDIEVAKNWLSAGTDRACAAPVSEEGKRRIRLFMERFTKVTEEPDGQNVDRGTAEHYEFLYRMTLRPENNKLYKFKGRNRIRPLQPQKHSYEKQDTRRLSGAPREHLRCSAWQAEDEMKTSEEKLVTGATVTLELGIDIGSLDQEVQIGAPATVSSLLRGWCAAADGVRFPTAVYLVDEVPQPLRFFRPY